MKTKWRMSRRLVTSFATTISVGIITAASATAGVANASEATPGASATNTNTCSFYRSALGPWDAIEDNSIRGDAWTVSGSYVYLERYTDSLSQCWKIISGFGNGEFELENAAKPVDQCLRVDNSNPKSPGDLMTVYSCQSETFQKFVVASPPIDDPAEAFAALEDENLCVAAQGSVTPGVALVLATCNFSHPGEMWYINTNP